MITLDAPELLAEIASAEKHRNMHLRRVRRLIQRYVGNWYRQDIRTAPSPENLIFNYVVTMLPGLVFDNPRVSVTPRRLVTGKQIAAWMREYLNFWIASDDVRDQAELAAVDMLFAYGVMGVCAFDNGQTIRPHIFRIAPEAFVMDPQCDHWHKAEYLGHQYRMSKAELQADPRVDQKLLATIDPDNDRDYGGMKSPLDRDRDYEDRATITLYDLFLPQSGQICTLAKNRNGKGQFVRPLTPFVGDPKGPYVLFGVYPVPGSPYPLGPIPAMGDHAEEVDAHLAAAAEEADSAKSIVLVADVANAQKSVENARSGDVISIPGLAKDGVVTLNLGGVNPARMAYVQDVLQRADRASGMSDQRRGLIQGSGVTAREVLVAKASGDARGAYVQSRFADCFKDALHRAGWYPFHDAGVIEVISWQDPVNGQPHQGYFFGGCHEGQEDQDWSSQYALEIEPYSMQRTDPVFEQEKAEKLTQYVVTLAPAMLQFPMIRWSEVIDMLGEANNVPDLAERVFNLSAGPMPMGPAGMSPAGVVPGPGGAGGMPRPGMAAGSAPAGMVPPQAGMAPTGPAVPLMVPPQMAGVRSVPPGMPGVMMPAAQMAAV